MNGPESPETPKSKIEKVKERYHVAAKALAEAGAMKFVELIEAKDLMCTPFSGHS